LICVHKDFFLSFPEICRSNVTIYLRKVISLFNAKYKLLYIIYGAQINFGDLTLYLPYDADQGAYQPVFQELREGLWLNRATRLVVLDFTFYNANINIFSIVKLAIEYLPVGGFLLNPQVTTVQVRTKECIGWVAVRDLISVTSSTCHEVDSF
jgi:hypothetical protein